MVARLSAAAVAAILLAGCTQQPNQQTVQAASPGSPVAAAAAAPASVPIATEPNSAVAEPAAQPPATAAPGNQLTVPAGTRIRIRLNETLDTKYCRPGERFAAQLEEPLVMGRRVVVPAGASIRGHVTSSKPSGRFKGRAVLGLTLDSIQVDGASYAISTNLTARVSSSHKKRNLAVIGGSAGGGAAIGAIAGGGVGALIGAGAGAGAGTVGEFFTGKKNVVLPVETELVFSLRTPITVRG